ncbi:MAG: peptidase [Bdellovibrio sp. CG10_big_fil_rev_8_21_14_0_10_47_8]|nr:MAG: peptidase [Bdellovibrio sp. CG10_big_fil_rev_8_21_14_0_10_47_8]
MKKLKSKGVKLRPRPKEIVIDRPAGLVFATEKELYQHFQPKIDFLEQQYQTLVKDDDLKEEEVPKVGKLLDLTLDEPAEIWHDDKTFKEFPIFHFIRPLDDLNAFHVAVTYVSSDDEPTFIFLHFVTKDLELVSQYRRGDLVYDRTFEEVGFGAIDGDALGDGDPVAMGLFLSMLKLRAETDVPFEQFQNLGEECREETIETADEIWKANDLRGNTLVTFIKDFADHEIKDLHYVAVTQEDPSSQMHTLLFSFPTSDTQLLDRYRHGENLQAEEVSQESSH